MPFENLFKKQPKQQLDIHNNPLFEPITPDEEEQVFGGVPPTFQEGVKLTNWNEKLEGLKGLTPEVNPPELKLLIQQPVDIKTNF
jgi:hypothetical protein